MLTLVLLFNMLSSVVKRIYLSSLSINSPVDFVLMTVLHKFSQLTRGHIYSMFLCMNLLIFSSLTLDLVLANEIDGHFLLLRLKTNFFFIAFFIYFTENTVTGVLPLAKKYQVSSVLKKCEDRLLTEIKYLINKEIRYERERRSMVEFFAMCLFLATKNDLESLYNRAFELLITYKLSRYRRSQYYEGLPDKDKWQLLEARMVKIEKADYVLDGD